ncbi:NAD(P)H-dependent oxidoreductase [Oceanomicrobium pacificus]|uniref:Flavodoxin family protein n=1 Tax=Oceanomicrobium pacificus TaxID=2692916 RepID=A0A6B0THH1_9RHOB|nr:NAD(P)H-dependent oxidoreductase [Oceanomicrobium pacificus]MXU63857.1 flavodoxin family protein [Oceanomicrobium pacificus]
MSDTKRSVLVLFAHPAPRRSEVNRPMMRAAARVPGVTVVDLYAEYPTLDFDIDREQARLREHDVVIFQHPLYWYSTPAILKEWQDLVLEHGFAYGAGGTALEGKIFLSATTTGGARSAYDDHGYNAYQLHELLRPLEQMAHLCGMTYLPPFALFASRRAREEGRIPAHIDSWTSLLRMLTEDRLDLSAAARADLLNPFVKTAAEA